MLDTGPLAGQSPGVSVIVPLHNGAAYIGETLTSIQRQTLPAFEVIVVDDGSSDDGRDIAHAHPLNPIVLSQPNHGVAVARNHGLSIATGDWVAFLDQDDLWHPDHLRRTLAWLVAHPDEQIVFVTETPFSAAEDADALAQRDPAAGRWASVHVPRSTALDSLLRSVDTTGTDAVDRFGPAALLRGPISVTTSFVARPQLLKLAGGFSPHAPAMDDYWLLVNAARLHPVVRIDQRTVFYRIHSQATSRSTRLGLPFLSSAIALRLGGGVIPTEEALRDPMTGPLHQHLIDELLTAPEYSRPPFRRAVDNIARILWPPRGLARRRARARLWARAPRARDAARSVRSTVRALVHRPDGSTLPADARYTDT